MPSENEMESYQNHTSESQDNMEQQTTLQEESTVSEMGEDHAEMKMEGMEKGAEMQQTLPFQTAETLEGNRADIGAENVLEGQQDAMNQELDRMEQQTDGIGRYENRGWDENGKNMFDRWEQKVQGDISTDRLRGTLDKNVLQGNQGHSALLRSQMEDQKKERTTEMGRVQERAPYRQQKYPGHQGIHTGNWSEKDLHPKNKK